MTCTNNTPVLKSEENMKWHGDRERENKRGERKYFSTTIVVSLIKFRCSESGFLFSNVYFSLLVVLYHFGAILFLGHFPN